MAAKVNPLFVLIRWPFVPSVGGARCNVLALKWQRKAISPNGRRIGRNLSHDLMLAQITVTNVIFTNSSCLVNNFENVLQSPS